MSTTKAQLRTAAEMNARLHAIGAELAARGGFPVAGWRALQEEQEQLQAAYRKQLDLESAPPSAESLRSARDQDKRAAALAKAIADAMR